MIYGTRRPARVVDGKWIRDHHQRVEPATVGGSRRRAAGQAPQRGVAPITDAGHD
jgi:hypothetical protein